MQDGVVKRNEYAQQNVGKGDGRRDGTEGLGKDDGGHLFASIFKGSGDIDNLVPMDSNLNRGAWKSMENEWAKALSDDKTGTLEIKVKIKPIYKDSTQRPSEFIVKYKIGDADWETERYKNEKGEKRKNDTRK